MRTSERWAFTGTAGGAFFLGAVFGASLYPRSATDSKPDPVFLRRSMELEDECRRLRDELARREGSEHGQAERIAELTERLGRAEAGLAEGATEKPPAPPATRRELPYRLASADDADAILADTMERADPEALFDLAAALLALGEPGYEKIVALLERFQEEADKHWYWRDILALDILGPRFFRAVVDREEDVLRFLLYLDEREGDLPEPLGEMRRELRRDMGPFLVGMYGGGATDIYDAYVPFFERGLEGEGNDPRVAVAGLAQLRSERAADVLIGLLDRAPRDLLEHVVVALAYQGSPRAAAALRAFAARVGTSDEALAKRVETALRRFR